MAVNPSNQPSPGMFFPTQTPGTVLCCTCGVPMAPNPANMCVRCLRSRVDITEGLPRQAAVNFCPDCSSYLQPPNKWMRFNLESQELLHFLVKRLHTRFSRLVTVCHAEFIFTEPHSKRLKIRLRVRREVLFFLRLVSTFLFLMYSGLYFFGFVLYCKFLQFIIDA